MTLNPFRGSVEHDTSIGGTGEVLITFSLTGPGNERVTCNLIAEALGGGAGRKFAFAVRPTLRLPSHAHHAMWVEHAVIEQML